MTKKEEKEVEVKVEKNSKNEDLKTLTELVRMYSNDVGEFKIFMNLSKTGNMQRYYDEQRREREGFENEPFMSENEFKKLIGV